MDKIERIKKLTKQLNYYRDAYYNDSVSEISDQEYDSLFDELKKLEEETGVVMANSPTHTVGYEVKSKLGKVKHSHPMLSLDKTKSIDDLKKFAGNNECLLMCKMDGLSILLTYENGELIRAESRGDGEIGEDVTHNAKVFENIPLQICFTGHLEIEGEAVITYDDFEKINSKLPDDEKYANPRNLVSGSVRQLDSSIAKERHIRFIAWKVPTEKDFMVAGLQDAETLGFETVPYIFVKGFKERYEMYIDRLKQTAAKKGFPIDGLVMSYNDIEYANSLGATGHHPKHSLAFKFYDDVYPTKLLDVEFTMGKTGVLTPTAVFEPVEIEGSAVERASLHNLSVMKKLGITHKGQTVNVYKSNMVIPQIESAEDDGIEITIDNRLGPIKICPICGSETNIAKENGSETLMCSNPECKGKLLGELSHFVSKNAINVEGLSGQTLQKFIDLGWLTSFQDIYCLSGHKEEMVRIDGFGEKSANKLLESIDKSRNTTLDRFIYALCIPLVGRTASKTVSAYFGNDYKQFFQAWSCGYGFHWTELDDFGSAMHSSMAKFWLDNSYMVSNLAKEFIFENKDKEKKGHIDLSGNVFVITGTLAYYKNRDELRNTIEEMGGKVSGSVSSKTTYLINNDTASVSGKNKKAKELGISVISEKDFVKMIS